MLDVKAVDLTILNNILKSHLSETTEIFVFGSRAKDTARKYSDLDLLIKTEQPLTYLTLSDIQEDLSESDLPFCVDLVEWNNIDEEFKRKIAPQMIKIF